VIYKLPANCTGLPQGIPPKTRLKDPVGALQGANSWTIGRTIGYRGPMPPPGHGLHHYRFTLYAVEAKLAVEPGLDKNAILQETQNHVLGQGRLVGTYQR
jgi:Raf kinase inhibitor-like YbhB/YbcL family protein